MQAIIMAGGEGTRLRPLTCNMPKPLAPLCGRPVLEYILELLKKNGFLKATLTLMYQGDKIVSHFDDDNFKGVELEYAFEDIPLGTAGCVKKACNDDEVLVISGDAMCDFDLQSAIKYHKISNADVTIIVKKVPDPREFGLVLFNNEGRITGFVEKPSFESCTTDMANTGVYILSKSALDLIPDGQKIDFAQDIFPEMMKRDMKLFAYEESGYWCDIGDFRSYRKCQRDMLEGKVECLINGHKELDGIATLSPSNFRGVRITPPCYIGKNVSIGIGSVVEAGSIICDDVTIGANSKIHGSIILDGAFLGERVSCNEAIICENAKMLTGSSAYENSVIGEKAIIGENATVESEVRIWLGKELDKNSTASFDIKYGNAKALSIDEDGLCGETNAVITPQIAANLGSSLSSCFEGNNLIGVGYRGDNASKALAMSLISGAMSAGGEVWDFGECIEGEISFCMRACGIKIGCFIEAGKTSRLKVLSENGLNPTRKQERKIEGGLNRGEYNKVKFDEFGAVKSSSSIKNLYRQSLNSILPSKLTGIRPEFKTSCTRVADIISEIIPQKIDVNGERVIFHISADGRKASAFTEETGYVFYERLIVLASIIVFEKGRDVSLPYSFPLIVDDIAKACGRKVLRFYNCSFDSSDKPARQLASESDFVRDGIKLCFIVLSYLCEKGISMKKATENIPDFYSTSRFVSIESSPTQILKQFCNQKAGLGEGVAISENNSRVLIRPAKTGKGVQMFVESFKSETAAELCEKFERLLKDNNK